jgi:predicted O-linked N-acetylglucosamine transferase (SPINDLY family)
MRKRLMKSFDQFIDVHNMSDLEIATLSRDLQIDIAVDLAGLTYNPGLRVFLNRCAPIQVNWLGYAGTVGLHVLDYIIADRICIPEGRTTNFSERVVYLPNCFMVDDSRRMPSNKKFTRDEFNLPEDAFVYSCFNDSTKYNPKVFDSWLKILRKVDNSVLWIAENNPYFREKLFNQFTECGISSQRVFFAPKIDRMDDHLARYQICDLFLDTMPYNAHATAMDSLKAGVPVLTLIGQSFASRVAASLLNAIGLPELIAHNQEEYEAIAIELANNPDKLSMIKNKLQVNKTTMPLFNTKLFTNHLEDAYEQMYERYQSGLTPIEINVKN